ncbi:TetR/AcrR family transcriptional regulator [Spirilliplanes yamanashiensis]|uniref:TetR family transcriptional regulator n=1 Tax=Spirilliplanes yamanashiensis TaxID=42233 RepID=A0A8J4DGF0_9ACTN|nr:TetR/AcrR family transcriptional regulator [Spirilliplanes yamanashiensis]MDP9814194.1 AcrR family transcriptional regulator [Spirilliplanes yamanashiensis]GIJ00824.1 TetR family transcriptional regulator [Spirilliplanes yamanashiensis]
MPRVSDEHLAARRRQILDAARRCFLAKGLHATSMQDLVREAGLSVGAVYRYFRSKEDIVSAIADEVVGSLDAALALDAARQPPTLAEAIEHVLRTVDKQLGPDGMFPIALQVWGESVTNPALGEIIAQRYATLRGRLHALAERAVATGELPPGTDPGATAAALLSLVPGYALQRTLTGTPDLETYVAGVRTLLSRPA